MYDGTEIDGYDPEWDDEDQSFEELLDEIEPEDDDDEFDNFSDPDWDSDPAYW